MSSRRTFSKYISGHQNYKYMNSLDYSRQKSGRTAVKAAQKIRQLGVAAVMLLTLSPIGIAAAQAVRVESVYWATRSGVSARVLLMTPANPVGAVFLVPGGHGNINLDVQAHIGWGEDDFAVRTRGYYAQAGFIVVIPDVAIDVKPPASLAFYRTSDAQAQDFGALINHLKTLSHHVWMVAYDRAAISAFNAIGKVPELGLDGLALVSPRVDDPESGKRAIESGAERALGAMPVLLVSHAVDDCSRETVGYLDEIARQARTSPAFNAVTITGGDPRARERDPWEYANDSCNRKPNHSLAGEDASTSKIIIDWILTRQRSLQ